MGPLTVLGLAALIYYATKSPEKKKVDPAEMIIEASQPLPPPEQELVTPELIPNLEGAEASPCPIGQVPDESGNCVPAQEQVVPAAS